MIHLSLFQAYMLKDVIDEAVNALNPSWLGQEVDAEFICTAIKDNL